ncbi:MAG: garA 1 [Planctomycetaceae bacterium]|nr:garA 1 [Planctomycetaceae bacterium]
MLGELIPTGGGDTIPLLKPKLLVGRRDECDIALRFPNVSSHHCELELVEGYWQIRDLNSSNGIKVNGIRCLKNWLLPGDEVSIAKHKYEVKYVASGPPPQPLEEFDPAVSLLEKAGLSRRDVEMADGEDISQSLMEKAGLEHRPRNPMGRPNPNSKSPPSNRAPNSSPNAPAPAKKKPDSDESIALKWLESDE